MTTDHETKSYCTQFLPEATLEKLEAGAFQQLCEHLRQRSEEVQNIDLMTISGFCRNCLAKWLVVEARKLSDELKISSASSSSSSSTQADADTIQALDAMGYDEAAEYVYGMGYDDWKKRYAKKATDAVMEKYNASKNLHAKHNKDFLAARADKPPTPTNASSGSTQTGTMMSKVCCQDPELLAAAATTQTSAPPSKNTRVAVPQVPSPPSNIKFRVGILTISDRASSGQYKTGDLSGPAVAASLELNVKNMTQKKGSLMIDYVVAETAIVPDDATVIQSKLKEWSSVPGALLDLILTTGGTGFAPRDVTPEATRAVLDRECHGFMSYISSECSKLQPLAALSRGTFGVCGRTLIANLPGNPQSVDEIMPLLLPLALHAIADLQKA